MENNRQNMKQSKSYEQKGFGSGQTGGGDPEYREAMANLDVPAAGKNRNRNKHRFWIGIAALVTFGTAMYFNSSTSGLDSVRSNGIGKGMEAGKLLVAADDSAGLEARDFEIQMKKNMASSRMLIWDFAAEDGDFVTVKVNGEVLATNIGILHMPVSYDIPIPSVVEIIGVKDGGGGITYGVKFPGAVQNNAYFNAAPVDSANVYTITGQ